MKKSIIALTVAAASLASVAQADGTTLYGSARFAYNWTDNADWAGNSASKAGNNPYAGSRFGIMGSNDLGNGLSANYKFEMGVGEQAIKGRDAYANLAGGFGAVQIGTFTLPYDDVVSYTDIFNGVGAGYALKPTTVGRTSNVLAYVSPNWSGFQFTAGIVANGVVGGANYTKNKVMLSKDLGLTSTDEHVDAYQITAGYNNNGIHAALGYVDIKDVAKAIDLSLGYSNDMFMIGLSAERLDAEGAKNNPVFANLAGSYNIDEANKIYASVGMYDADTSAKTQVSGGLGYQHNFSANTRVWAEYEYLDTKTGGSDDDRNTISLGLRTDF